MLSEASISPHDTLRKIWSHFRRSLRRRATKKPSKQHLTHWRTCTANHLITACSPDTVDSGIDGASNWDWCMVPNYCTPLSHSRISLRGYTVNPWWIPGEPLKWAGWVGTKYDAVHQSLWLMVFIPDPLCYGSKWMIKLFDYAVGEGYPKLHHCF